MKLHAALQECTLSLLRRIAASHGVAADEATLRSELAERILQRLLEPGYLARYLSTLSPAEEEVLRAVAASGWTVKGFVLERRYSRRLTNTGASAGAPDTNPVLSLLQRGILFRCFAPIGSWRGEVYHVPEELSSALSVFPAFSVSATPPKPDVRAKMAPDVVHEWNGPWDVFRLLSFLQTGDRRVQRGTLHSSDLAKLERWTGHDPAEKLSNESLERWRFIIHLCVAGGWAVRQGALLKPGKGVVRLLSGPLREVRERLLSCYLKDRSWSDLAAAGKVRPLLGGRQIDETVARQLLLHYLEEMAGDGWTDEVAFCEALRAANPDFLREDYTSPSWAVVDVATGTELYGPASWEAVEGRWVRYLLHGPLHWLGVVRWGATRDGKVVGFQLQQMADARELDGLRLEVEMCPGHSREDNVEPVALRSCDLGLLYRLAPYVEVRRRDSASCYCLTRWSVVNGLERGGSWSELSELLRSLVAAALPEEVMRQVQEWADGYGRFTLEQRILISGANEELDMLFHLPGVARCLQSRLGPNSYQVARERVSELIHAMREAGYPPRVDPSLRAGASGRISGDTAVLGECLYALLLSQSTNQWMDPHDAAEAVRQIKIALGPDMAKEIAHRALDARKKAFNPE